LGGGLSVTKHANGRDWWIIVKKHYRNTFHKFLLTPGGIQNMGSQQIGLDYQARLLDSYSFSPNGEILAGPVGNINSGNNSDIVLFKFDRCSGQLSNHQMITTPYVTTHWCEDIDFSSNSKFLYANEKYRIYQFDLTGIDTPGVVQQTMTLIADTAWTTQVCDSPAVNSQKNYFVFGALAADGRIYYTSNIACPELTYIENPDSLGLASAFNYQGIFLTNYSLALPYFPNYRLGPLPGSGCDSLTSVHELQAQDISLYPNPASDRVQISASRALNGAVITLFNVQGQQLLQQTPGFGTTFEVQLPGSIKSGIYFIRIQSNEGVVTKKVVLRR
jgi:hypothetical protein